MLGERNGLSFALRRFSAWEMGAYRERAEPKHRLFQHCPIAQAEAARLQAAYDLSTLWEQATAIRYRETLTYLLWLETLQALQPAWFDATLDDAAFATSPGDAQNAFRWLDVGAKNWSYVAALPAFLHKAGLSAFGVDGVELDPYRRYINLTTRGQMARAHTRALPQARYHEGDVLDWRCSAHIISHFLPFVFPEPHEAWGLPDRHFRPKALLAHALALLEPGGLLLIVNQGEAEADEQARLLAHAAERFPIDWRPAGQLPAPFIQYRYPRYGWVCRKS